MDSKTVNKLIRSEVWPVLRLQGFSKFDSRTAWRYRGPLVDVINFQSFNSYMAELIGCTTFSFAVNLGVYLRGSVLEPAVKIDATGTQRPQESACPFRANLKKRTPVDRFARKDIFYIAEDGSTMGAAIREVLFLLNNEAPPWFAAFNDLAKVVRALTGMDDCLIGTESLGLGSIAAPGSFRAADLIATLQLERHAHSPDQVSASTCLEAVDVTVRAMLDSFGPGYDSPCLIEFDSRRIRDLLVRISPTVCLDASVFGSHPVQGELLGAHWNFGRSAVRSRLDSKPSPSARDSLWPTLRAQGFVEFTDRLAHRPNSDSIEVVSFVPVDPTEKKANNYPDGLFRIGIGVFWPELADNDAVRKNRRGEFRPRLQDCLLQLWLMPALPPVAVCPTCFDSISQAVSALARDAENWFSIWRDPSSRKQLLEQPDWVILALYPTMRGHGSSGSVPRMLMKAMFASEQPTERAAAMKSAQEAVSHYPEHRQSRYQSWVEKVEASWQR